jgi:hypothetical protein
MIEILFFFQLNNDLKRLDQQFSNQTVFVRKTNGLQQFLDQINEFD